MKKNVVIVVLGVLVLGLSGLLIYQNVDNKQINNKEDQDQESDSKSDSDAAIVEEVEVNIEDYEKIYQKIDYDYETSPFIYYENDKWNLRSSNFKFADLKNSWFIETALRYIQYNTTDWEEETTVSGSVKKKIKAAKVDGIIKELFGNNFNYHNESTTSWEYKNGYYYLEYSHFNEPFAYYVEDVVYKITKSDDKVYVYKAVGVREEITKGDKTDLDYYGQSDWVYDLKAVYLYNSLDLTEKVDGNFMGQPTKTTSYVAEHPDEFAHYKYTFTKEGDHYIFTNIERVK